MIRHGGTEAKYTHTHTHSERVILLSHGNNDNANAPQYYVTHIAFLVKLDKNWTGKSYKIAALIQATLRFSRKVKQHFTLWNFSNFLYLLPL